jgi:hypothetical protein
VRCRTNKNVAFENQIELDPLQEFKANHHGIFITPSTGIEAYQKINPNPG